MAWFFFFLVAHLVFGLTCAWMAYETKLKAELWFLAGALFGGLAFLICLMRIHHRTLTGQIGRWIARIA